MGRAGGRGRRRSRRIPSAPPISASHPQTFSGAFTTSINGTPKPFCTWKGFSFSLYVPSPTQSIAASSQHPHLLPFVPPEPLVSPPSLSPPAVPQRRIWRMLYIKIFALCCSALPTGRPAGHRQISYGSRQSNISL